MTNPIPRAAAPVVWFIRWWVKKPRTLPRRNWRCLLWRTELISICPLGFIPEMKSFAPYADDVADDTGLPQGAVHAFIEWWDSQTDARAAVDAVWGKDG